jgi:hypothetical protein
LDCPFSLAVLVMSADTAEGNALVHDLYRFPKFFRVEDTVVRVVVFYLTVILLELTFVRMLGLDGFSGCEIT